jgi:uncharacterized protein (TIGR01777 family)
VRVLVTGSTGLIGSALVKRLESSGHRVVRAVRRETAGPDEVRWDPEKETIDAAGIAGIDAAVHLAGESIGARLRWDDEHKRRVLNSRVSGTRTLAMAMARLDPRPRALLSGSAVGIYGDRGVAVLTEESPPGTGFLAELCVQWEATTAAAEDAGIRVVHLRSGLVLSRDGGLFPRMLTPARFGLGARFGNGRQFMSWITLADQVGAMVHLLGDESAAGPFNLTAPGPVSNADFTRMLGRALHRPAALFVPASVLRRALGEAAQELLLSGQRAIPERLQAGGYRFQHRHLDDAFIALLAPRSGPPPA